MKKTISFILCLTIFVTMLAFDISAADSDVVLTANSEITVAEGNETRVSGLITAYGLSLEKSGTTLKIYGQTLAAPDVVKCGFKNLVIQRRASSDDSWKEYYDFGNRYIEMSFASFSTTLVVPAGYQYRISCKHYAKKNLLSVQTIANTSNIVAVS